MEEMLIPTLMTLKRKKIIMILCDGLRADTAQEQFGYINSLVDNGNVGIRTISIVDNPSVSRTNYETIHTGVPSLIHGITSNLVVEKSKMTRNIFKDITEAGGTTGVVGSSWLYSLYGKEDYLHYKHKELNKEDGEYITYGRFYSDDIPDEIKMNPEGIAHTLQMSNLILYKYHPDYLFIHLITPDIIGHHDGVGEKYNTEANRIDAALGVLVPHWLSAGYDIIITSDHGMDSDKNHGGKSCDVMKAPLYILSKKGWKPKLNDITYHTDLAPMILERLISDTDFRSYQESLISNSGYKKEGNDCI
jgi:predicted AlkP superfamily pyrophosphatase or phosphodiesterase